MEKRKDTVEAFSFEQRPLSEVTSVRRIYEQDKKRYAKYAVTNVRPLWMVGVNPTLVYPQECSLSSLPLCHPC